MISSTIPFPPTLTTKTIRDNLHNSIDILPIELQLIDTPFLQRLRRISQLGLISQVFPGATHTRFEHSIGAMHIAGLTILALIRNQRRFLERYYVHTSPALQETADLLHLFENDPTPIQLLRITALVHDIGHGPCSHDSEYFMPTADELARANEIPDYLATYFQKYPGHRSHENYTLIMIAQLPTYCPSFTNYMAHEVSAILKSDIAPPEGSILYRHGLQSLLHELISGEIDVDRMDYLLRDSRETGTQYGYFDLQRILHTLGMYQIDDQTHLAIRYSGLPAFEHYLFARYNMYRQVYFHHTNTAFEGMLAYIGNHSSVKLPGEIDAFVTTNDFTFQNDLLHNHELSGTLTEIVRDIFWNRRPWHMAIELSNEQATLSDTEIKAMRSSGPIDDIPHIILRSITTLSHFHSHFRTSSPLKLIYRNPSSQRWDIEDVHPFSPLINSLSEQEMRTRLYVAR